MSERRKALTTYGRRIGQWLVVVAAGMALIWGLAWLITDHRSWYQQSLDAGCVPLDGTGDEMTPPPPTPTPTPYPEVNFIC
jgi:hypothetical protein